MELIKIQPEIITIGESLFDLTSSSKAFINGNTLPMSYSELSKEHIIPVFVKDNEPLISHADFIDASLDIANQVFGNKNVMYPAIRVSHPIKGRIPDAKDKPAKDLLEHEKTIYYERMMFLIEIPSVSESVNGNSLNLVIGGVKSYSIDNLYNRKGTDEHFKIFIGFENKVCTNLCVWSDGIVLDLKVKNLAQLMKAIYELVVGFNSQNYLKELKRMSNYTLSEHQFATLLGRLRMYPFINQQDKREMPSFLLGDSQVNQIAKDYFFDKDFKCDSNGEINLWNIYNLLTGANKSSYIDTFVARSSNAFDFTRTMAIDIEFDNDNWFLK
jgi:Domain of unknown function, B. Theta Gene description (DUF3871)